jgi:hypothetical protein
MSEDDKSYLKLETLDLFNFFVEKAWDVPAITGSFQLLKERLGISAELSGLSVYDGFKAKLTQWKAKNLWDLFDKKINLDEYKNQESCKGMNVAVVGCGPIGMRFAIEAAFLGCNVFVVDKRSYFSRNNVLHLWPFTITDLKKLGAKKFFGQFCAGSIDHISIRSLQSILLKACLLLGIQIYFNTEYVKILEPGNGRGWHAQFNPANHLLNSIDFSVLVGAEGKKSSIPGFDRKELRAKLALAITANFVNTKTAEEAAIQEISGVAFIFNQKFFKDLKEDTGIDLENILYYKDDTHYFIMTAKKQSLLQKGVLRQDFNDINQLLAPSNKNLKAMYDYSRQAAEWSTGLSPDAEFALNHKGVPDVDLFDFTSIYQAEYAAKAIRRGDKDLLMCLVGDSLVQPFWPQGTGCARGILSALDAAWMIRGFGEGKDMLSLLAERESLFQYLTQTKSETLAKKFDGYTINPRTRYPNINMNAVKPGQTKHLYDFDGEIPLQLQPVPINVQIKEPTKPQQQATPSIDNVRVRVESKAPVRRTHSKSINEAGSVVRALYGTPEESISSVDRHMLIRWFSEQVKDYKLKVNDLGHSFRNGLVLCALIHRYNPDIIPQYHQLSPSRPLENNRLAFRLLHAEYDIQELLKPSEMANPDKLAIFTYLSSVYETFQTLELPEKKEESVAMAAASPSDRKLTRKLSRKNSKMLASPTESWNTTSSLRRTMFSRKQSVTKKEKKNTSEKQEESSLVKSVKSKDDLPKKDNNQIKDSPVKNTKQVKDSTKKDQPKANGATPVAATPSANVATRPTEAKKTTPRPVSTFGMPTSTSDVCFFCNKRVYLMERMTANGVFFHRHCFRCSLESCGTQLSMGNFAMSKGDNGQPGKFFCKPHYRQLFMSNPEAINYARSQPDRQAPPTSPPTVSPSVSPIKKDLETIGEEEIMTTTEVTVEVEEEESKEEYKRKRTLSQRISDYWRRRSRSRSKSKSKSKTPEKSSTDGDEVEDEIMYSSPPTPPTPESPPTSLEPSPVKSTSVAPSNEVLRRPPPIIPSLVVIESDDTESPIEGDSFRMRSPPLIISRPGSTPPPRLDRLSVRNRGRGQTSIVRAFLNVDEEDEIALEKRQKQQERFRDAQSIQREMSQIELQYEELEEIAREVEQNLRDAEGTMQEETFMKAWLNLVSERNSLVRKTSELSMSMKALELEDKKCELEKEMRDIQDSGEGDNVSDNAVYDYSSFHRRR